MLMPLLGSSCLSSPCPPFLPSSFPSSPFRRFRLLVKEEEEGEGEQLEAVPALSLSAAVIKVARLGVVRNSLPPSLPPSSSSSSSSSPPWWLPEEEEEEEEEEAEEEEEEEEGEEREGEGGAMEGAKEESTCS